ncbi:MAG: hypothetical protein LW832_07295 [Parachlamydia sp.]|jgi:hypothetical protein|nr:hypothetical protein [Parachlamydia sp.]
MVLFLGNGIINKIIENIINNLFNKVLKMIRFEHPNNSIDYPNKKAKYNHPILPEDIILTIFNLSTSNDMKSLICTCHDWNDKKVFELYPNIKKYHLNNNNIEIPFQLSRLKIIEKVQNISTRLHFSLIYFGRVGL